MSMDRMLKIEYKEIKLLYEWEAKVAPLKRGQNQIFEI